VAKVPAIDNRLLNMLPHKMSHFRSPSNSFPSSIPVQHPPPPSMIFPPSPSFSSTYIPPCSTSCLPLPACGSVWPPFSYTAIPCILLQFDLQHIESMSHGRITRMRFAQESELQLSTPWQLSNVCLGSCPAFPIPLPPDQLGTGQLGSISYHFGYECMRLDTRAEKNVTVSFLQANSLNIHTETADLVVGADGIGSAVRAHLQRTAPGFGISQVLLIMSIMDRAFGWGRHVAATGLSTSSHSEMWPCWSLVGTT